MKSFSVRELIVAVIAVALGATSLAYAIIEERSSEAASESVVSVTTLEAALASALRDPKNYRDEALKMALRSGRVPQLLSFHFNIASASGSHAIEIHPNETLTLDRNFQICKTYPVGDCGYKMKLILDLHPPAFSYSVASSFPDGVLNLQRSDRTAVLIPRSYYRDPLHAACDLSHEIGMTGLQSSDKFDCLARPTKVCPRGSLPKAVVVDPQTHALEFECGRATKVARCPAFYALSRVKTASLDPAGGAVNAKCVRTTQTIAVPPRQPAPAQRLVGRACPSGYRSDSSCSLVKIRTQAGHCGAGAVQPVAGQIRFTQNKSPGSVDCGVELRSQTCGAIWEAQAALNIRCVLDQPEFVDAI